jgi:long-subunit acyl-CoA synthetase (AMP-forming)
MTTTQRIATLGEAFAATASEHLDAPALQSADGATSWTWREYSEGAAAAAAGLAGLGVGRGDTVALWMTNRPEFHVADTAALMLGAAPFSVYSTFTPEQAEHVIGDAGSRVLVTEAALLDHALAIRARRRTALELIVLVDGDHAEALTWEGLLLAAPAGFDLGVAAAAVQPDDLATLIYTSGTTGAPKGVELTHANVVAQSRALRDAFGLDAQSRAISWLPMAHIAERLCTHYIPMLLGWSVTCVADPRSVASVLPQVRPEFFFSPPRLWEKLRSAALARGLSIADLGLDAVQVGVVGAAPCPPEVVEFWQAAGLPLCEVYGMSETTGVATVNPPDDARAGTVGVPLPSVEVRLSDDGEILMRGPVVMRGYRNRPDATAEAIDADGWLHSGDIGVVDEDGYLKIVDRIKELIISAAGKNMSPANIEATLKSAGSAIGCVCAVGDGRPYNVALVTLDPAVNQTLADPEAEVAAQIARGNERLARVEQIKKFKILDGEWVADGDELTPTMKLKRGPIAAKYAAEIEALYSG